MSRYILQEDGVSKILLEDLSGAILQDGIPVALSTTGLTVTASIASQRSRSLAVTALAISDQLVTSSGITHSASLTSTGLTVSESITKSATKALADTGLAASDTLQRRYPVALTSNAFPSFGTGPVLDNFNRANENPLSQGGNWTALLSGSNSALQIVSNAVVGTASAGNRSAMSYSGAGTLTDCEAWVTLSGAPSIPNDQFLYSGVFARQANTGFVLATGQRSYQVISDPGANEIILQYVNVGGGVTVLGSWPITTKVGDSLGIRCVGTTISAYYKPVGGDWQLLGSATSTAEPSGYIGLLTYDTTFSMDNFGGGLPQAARPFDSIQPNHYTVALTDNAFTKPFGATSVLDNFQRPNEAPLSQGGNWTRSGTFGGALNLVSRVTVPSTTAQFDSESYIAGGDLYDCEVYATFAELPWTGNSGDEAGVIIRQNLATDSQKDCYILLLAGDSNLYLNYNDTSGTSHTLAEWVGVGVAVGDSIGLRAVGTTLTAYYRSGSGAWQILGSLTDSRGVHGYVGLHQNTSSGVPNGFNSFGGGHVGLWDSILPTFAPHGLFPVQGLTVSDTTPLRAVARLLTDTALTITDAMVLFLNGNAIVSLTDNGLILSDAITKFHSTAMTDTGVSVVGDTITAGPIRVQLPVDTGLTISDTLAKTVTKTITDTGVTVSDTTRRSYPVAISDTGLTVTESTKKVARKVVADTGMSFTDTLVVQKNGHNASVTLTDRGATIVGTIAKAAIYFRAVPGPSALPDIGLNITDGIRRTVVPFNKPTKPQADFTYTSAGLTVTFTDTSTPGSAPIGSWSWHFGDGGSSSATNPVHTYSLAGTYNVTLSVTTVYGTSSITKPINVSSGVVTFGYHIDAVAV